MHQAHPPFQTAVVAAALASGMPVKPPALVGGHAWAAHGADVCCSQAWDGERGVGAQAAVWAHVKEKVGVAQLGQKGSSLRSQGWWVVAGEGLKGVGMRGCEGGGWAGGRCWGAVGQSAKEWSVWGRSASAVAHAWVRSAGVEVAEGRGGVRLCRWGRRDADGEGEELLSGCRR